MGLSAYFQVLKRRRLVIIMTLAVALAIAFLISTRLPAVYRATATLRMLTAVSGSADYLQYDVRYAERLMNTYANLATSQPVLDELARALKLTEPPKATVTLITNTELLQVSVEDRDPELARDAANRLCEILISEAKARYEELRKVSLDTLSVELSQSQIELEQTRQDYEAALSADFPDAEQIQVLRDLLTLREGRYTTLLAQYERVRALVELQAPSISVVEAARTPKAPSQPQRSLILGLAALLGLVGGLGMAFLLEGLDTRVYSETQLVSMTGLPILGEIPASRRRQAGLFSEHSIEQEAVHRLSVNLFPPEAMRERRPVRQVLMVTSVAPGDGKSTLTTNLGLAAARLGYKTVLIDADARSPALHQFFGVPNVDGLSDLLAGEIGLEQAIFETKQARLHVIPSGPWTSDFFALLGSAAMVELRDTLMQIYDVNLIDSPTFLAAADGAVLASLVEGVLLVLRLGRARREAIAAILDQLAHLNVQPVGLVLNRTPNSSAHFDYRPVSGAGARDTRRSETAIAGGVSPQSAAWSASDMVGKEGADP